MRLTIELTNEQITDLYRKVNEMMAELGAAGQISTRNEAVIELMDTLFHIDGGVYKDKAELKCKE